MGKGLAGLISFSPGDRVNGSVRLVLPFAFFCYLLARRGLCLCVLMWPGGIIIRGDDEPKEDLQCCTVPGRALPTSNLEGNRGEAVDLFFCLAVLCSSKQMLLLLWET